MIEQLTIPGPDAMPLPAPVWLLKSLLLLTFLLHIIAMNIVLGGSFTCLITDFIGRRKNSPHHLALARRFSRVIPIAMAFTISLGVAPLLFLQVLYGQLFYTSSILMAWPWLSVIGLVILAYYGFYLYSYRWESLKGIRLWILMISGLLVATVGMIYANNITLMLTPEKFSTMYHSNPAGTHWNFDEPTLIPRYLHFFVASFAITGLFILIYGLGKLKSETDFGRWAIGYGGMWFVIATIIQMCVGIWFLFSLPTPVMMIFMGQNILATSLLGLAFILPVVSAVLILSSIRAKNPKPTAVSGIAVLSLTLVVMVVMRDLVRDAYLAEKFNVYARTVEPAWIIVGLFALILIVGLGVVFYMLRRVIAAMSSPVRNS